MDKNIKEVVEGLHIPFLRNELQENREELFKLERTMSNMTLDHSVGLYAYNLDKINYLLEIMEYSVDKNLIYDNLKEIEVKVKELEKNPKVQEYKKVYKKHRCLKSTLHNYYQVINIDLRESLANNLELPNIYVEQHYYDYYNYYKHIITKDILVPEIVMGNMDYTLISPTHDMDSFRDFRHFYNRISYKYLEALTMDYSFDLEGKKLGGHKELSLKI